MPSSTVAPDLRKGEKIVAAVDLRGVPVGTTGKVALVEGLSWIRYWVRFDNGVAIGSVRRNHLATAGEWKRKLSGADEVVAGAGDDAAADGDEAAGGDGAASGGITTPNGALVPQKLIDRAKAARARLGG